MYEYLLRIFQSSGKPRQLHIRREGIIIIIIRDPASWADVIDITFWGDNFLGGGGGTINESRLGD